MLTSLSKSREVMVGSRTSLLGRSYRVLTVRRPIAPATRTGTRWSYGDDLDEVFDTGKVAWVARVEPRSVGVCGGRDQKIHHPGSRLTAGRNRGGELSVAGRHRIVYRQRGEPALEVRESAEPLSTGVSVGCNEHGEVEFGEGDGADCQLALQGWNVRGYQNAGVEYRVQRRLHGSATD